MWAPRVPQHLGVKIVLAEEAGRKIIAETQPEPWTLPHSVRDDVLPPNRSKLVIRDRHVAGRTAVVVRGRDVHDRSHAIGQFAEQFRVETNPRDLEKCQRYKCG